MAGWPHRNGYARLSTLAPFRGLSLGPIYNQSNQATSLFPLLRPFLTTPDLPYPCGLPFASSASQHSFLTPVSDRQRCASASIGVYDFQRSSRPRFSSSHGSQTCPGENIAAFVISF